MNLLNRSKSHFRQMICFKVVLMGAGLLLGVSVVTAADQPAKKTDAAASTAGVGAPEENYNNLLSLSAASTFVNGNDAEFSQKHQVPNAVFGGVDALHYENAVGKEGKLQVDGRGIVDNHDYDLELKLAAPETGFINAGYNEFRTWYNGDGGYLPITGTWIQPRNEKLTLDRGDFWVEGGLTLPDLPELTLKYEHLFRNGKKDSTSWGDTTVGKYNRGIAPAFWDIDEKRDILSGDIKDTLGNTGLGLGVRYEKDSIDNSLNEWRGANSKTAQRFATTENEVDSGLFDAHAFTDTSFNPKYRLTTGYLFSDLKSDLGGSRIFGSDYDAAFNPLFAKRQYHDEGFYNLDGRSSEKQYVANINLMANPWQDVFIIPSARIEKLAQKGDSRFIETAVGAAPKLTTSQEDLQAFNDRGLLSLDQELKVRYTGIKDWVLYISGDWTEGNGDRTIREVEYETQELVDKISEDDVRFTQKYTAGATWYALKNLSLAAQYYHKFNNNKYKDSEYMRDLETDTDDANARVTWRPLNTLTLVTRYDLQLANMYQDTAKTSEIQSADMQSHIFGESITWTPVARLYLQTGFNYAMNTTRTPANDMVSTNVTLNNTVLPSRNDYWNISQIVGWALDQKTDLQLEYSYYLANDYRDNSSTSVPYGAGDEEHDITASLKHDITKNMKAILKYGYYLNRDKASGGNKDYNAQLVSASLQYLF